MNNPLSLREETKQKFDDLLKKAAAKKRSKSNISQEELLKDADVDEGVEHENTAFDEQLEENKSYIMDKFLNYSDNNEIKEIPEKIPPIPKPRKKVLAESRRNSIISQGTYNKSSPNILSPQNSISSNKTYNVEEIGDVVFHDVPSKPKVVIKQHPSQESLDSIKSLSEDLKSHTKQNNKKYKDIENKDEKIVDEQSDNEETVEEITEVRPKVKERKRHKHKDIEEEELIDDISQHSEIKKENDTTIKKYNYENLIEIIIHRTDKLQIDTLINHPVVKVHIVDAATGKYFRKSDKSRNVVFFYENIDWEYISPIMTQAYNLREKRSLYPCWEETILLNEDYNYFLDECEKIIIFFEVLDFIVPSRMSHSPKKDLKGWHKIAFAFLKLTKENLSKQIRLQLYHFININPKRIEAQSCPIWAIWKTKKLRKYPSTLFVSLKSVKAPNITTETLRSKTPIEKEKTQQFQWNENNENIGNVENVLDNDGSSEKTFILTKDNTNQHLWSRKPHDVYKIPDHCVAKFNSYDEGCFIAKFSNDGLHLACSVKIEEFYCIIIISVISLQEFKKFSCHQGLIHWIRWLHNDSFLLTASADNTISLYNFNESRCVQVLPHPSFVYCADEFENTIATGCYDTVVRIWITSPDKKKVDLFQELEGHKGYVTTLCFSKKNNHLYSADSKGAILEWAKNEDWELKREIKILELREVVINGIKFLPRYKRLIIHSRDSIIRIMHIKSACILQRLHGAVNNKVQIFSTTSPCGTFVVTGAEDGYVYIWNIKTGDIVSTIFPYQQNNGHLAIHCVDFHPLDNILVISHYGSNLPILLYDTKSNRMNQTHNISDVEKRDLKSTRHMGKIQFDSRDKWDFKGILQRMDDIIASNSNVK